jgi:hypothetical protein
LKRNYVESKAEIASESPQIIENPAGNQNSHKTPALEP